MERFHQNTFKPVPSEKYSLMWQWSINKSEFGEGILYGVEPDIAWPDQGGISFMV
jgi:hypothetical protein